MKKLTFKVLQNGKLDKFLLSKDISLKEFKIALRKKDILVNSIRVKDNVEIQKNDEITIFLKEEKSFRREDFIIYEDDNIIVANKPRKMISCRNDRVDDALSFDMILNAIAVHRLDYLTQGIMIYAKNKEVERELLNAFKEKYVHKQYLAEVVGNFQDEGIQTAYLKKDKNKSQVSVNSKQNGGVQIQTEFKVEKRKEKSTIIRVNLLTGKTHQIRAHCAFLHHFILGDKKYGEKVENSKLGANFLHLSAVLLTFSFPKSSKLVYLNKLQFECDADFK